MQLAQWRGDRHGRAIGLGVALLVHATWWAMWNQSLLRAPKVGSEPPPLQVRLLELLPPAHDAAATPSPRQRPRESAVARPRASAVRSAVEAPLAPIDVVGDAPTAAAGTASIPLLETDATRRAIREAARRRPIGELARAQGAQERLGHAITQSARGDCLQGEYAGGGMGLLSLPFWIAAELRDKCRR